MRLPIKESFFHQFCQSFRGSRAMNTCFSEWDEDCNRAKLLDDFEEERQMVKTRRAPARRGGKPKKGSRSKLRVRVQRGRVGLKIPGFQKIQYIHAAALVRHIPKTRLQKAGKKVLGRPPPRIRKRKTRKVSAARKRVKRAAKRRNRAARGAF